MSPDESFTTHIAEGRVDLHFSPDVSWFNLVQYDNDSRVLGVQSRFRWIVEPGSDLFVVFQQNWEQGDDDVFRPDVQEATAKLVWTFRF
jgi:hypothetical protein